MTYSVFVKHSAQKEIKNLPPHIRRSVAQELINLEHEPRPIGRFRVLRPPLEGYRIRIRDWRILYNVDDETRQIFIYSVSHRREAYR